MRSKGLRMIADVLWHGVLGEGIFCAEKKGRLTNEAARKGKSRDADQFHATLHQLEAILAEVVDPIADSQAIGGNRQ